jgi:hypothetical protein
MGAWPWCSPVETTSTSLTDWCDDLQHGATHRRFCSTLGCRSLGLLGLRWSKQIHLFPPPSLNTRKVTSESGDSKHVLGMEKCLTMTTVAMTSWASPASAIGSIVDAGLYRRCPPVGVRLCQQCNQLLLSFGCTSPLSVPEALRAVTRPD